MARIFIDGFESGDHDMWDAESNATIISSAGLDMNGDYCLDLNATSEYLQKAITATDEMYFAFLWRVTNAGASESALHVLNSATSMLFIRKSSTTGFLDVYRGTTNLDTGTHAIDINTTYLIEIHIKIADSGGRAEVKIDGVSDIDFTGDTKIGADTQFNQVKLGNQGAYGVGYSYYDNFIMDGAAWIGNTQIQALVPTGAGNTTGWTPSAGNNYACVDEIPANDADYVSINSNDVVDTYAAGDLVGTVGTVKCVQVQSRVKTDGAPTPTNLKLIVRSGGTDYLSGDKSVPATAKSLCYLWEQNPAVAAAWTESTVNSAEVGIKSIA